MNWFIAVVLILLLVTLLWVVLSEHEDNGNDNSTDFELWRINQAKQAAMEDVRRRRLFAEEQLRRLGRWSK